MAKSGRTPGAAVAVSVLSALVVSGCSRTGGDESVVARSGEIDSLDLEVGDCFNASGPDEVATVELVACDDPHDHEVFHAFLLEDGPYPGDDTLRHGWLSGCLDAFEPFVGVPFDVSSIDLSGLYPTAETWEGAGDREVICSVKRVDGERMVGSARGVGT